ncbi:hypothetical protein AU378_04950 [Chryseobacterium kwangjuense]|uniref:Uncharacterized protein n=1 Tax=Chryseobacterium kwangjuense TaxID=267125 RepID=A0A135WJQ9_9FLAO|nr:hypothetical protein AU378_04950 [Chryseobacterium kwangjuense]
MMGIFPGMILIGLQVKHVLYILYKAFFCLCRCFVGGILLENWCAGQQLCNRNNTHQIFIS